MTDRERMTDIQGENEYLNRIRPVLLGAEVAHIQYQKSEKCRSSRRFPRWDSQPLEIHFSNGVVLFAMSDSEGNDGGAYGLDWNEDAKPKTIRAIKYLPGRMICAKR